MSFNWIRIEDVSSILNCERSLLSLSKTSSRSQRTTRINSSFHSSLEFDRFDLEQTSEQEFHLNCFTDICQQHLEKKHSPISTKAFVDLLNRQDGGLIDQAIHDIQLHSPPMKTYLGMQDQESWKEFLLRPSIFDVFRLLTGLSSAAPPPEIQVKIAQTLLPILHKIEQLTNAGKVGVLAEDLLQALTDNEEVARQIDQLRQQIRAEKKRLAQEARERKMKELKLNKDTSRLSESPSSASPNPAAQAQVAAAAEGDAGHVCCIYREGYRDFPK